jgi:uncharacterized membrane protein
MAPLGQLHLATAIASLLLGAIVLLFTTKGTRRHRQLGWAYVISMLFLNVTALMIYRLFGGFGPFHVAAIISLVTLILGVSSGLRARFARARRDPDTRGRAIQHHYHWMTWSYVGLLAAAVAETATRLPIARPAGPPGAAFAVAVVVGSVAVFVVGGFLIRRSASTQLARFVSPRGR